VELEITVEERPPGTGPAFQDLPGIGVKAERFPPDGSWPDYSPGIRLG
jgi:hypothetical protein